MNPGSSNTLFFCDTLSAFERSLPAIATMIYFDAPANTSGTFGTTKRPDNESYISYLAQVTQQAKRLLKDEGTLFIHLTASASLDLRFIFDQSFGTPCKYEILWPRAPRRNMRGPHNSTADVILAYSKSAAFIYNAQFRPLTVDEVSSRYRLSDERGLYVAADLTAPFVRPNCTFTWRGQTPPEGRCWKFSNERLEALAADNQIYFPASSGTPRLKRYLGDHPGVEIGMIWDDISDTRRGHTPSALAERLIMISSNDGDRILDARVSSGTTLSAAGLLGRPWCGIVRVETRATFVETLSLRADLELGEFVALDESELLAWPIVNAEYHDVLTSMSAVATLQQDVKALTAGFSRLKQQMNLQDDGNQDEVDTALGAMEVWITEAIANQSRSVESYITDVCIWLTGWDRLDKASQAFLPQAELLFDNIPKSSGEDYSPFIIQYCRALENELLIKLFSAYIDDVHIRDVKALLSEEGRSETHGDRVVADFASSVLKRKKTYTLGQMNQILRLTKAGGRTLQSSVLLQDFREFTVRYFGEQIIDKHYLDQIERINTDFRCKAAHPYILDSNIAERCRDQVRSCLNELIASYSGDSVSRSGL